MFVINIYHCHTLTGNQPYSTSLAQLCHLHSVTWQTLQNKDTLQTAQHICLFHNIEKGALTIGHGGS